MRSNWKTVTLSSLGKIITGKTPPTSKPEYYNGTIPFITPSDMDGRRFINFTKRYLSETGLKNVYRSSIPKDTIMVSCIGSDMGKVAICCRNSITNQQINSIIINENNFPLFIYYNLLPRKMEIKFSASGSAQPILNKTSFGKLPILIPPLNEQKVIAHILGALDDKIELNQKINQTLESIAQAMFKSWFVDFDPVHAKANAQGEDEYDTIAKELGISREILDLFPSEFEESELGLIPKGWRPNKIENYIEILDSKRVPLSKNEREKRKGNIPYYGATSIMDYIDDFLFDEPLTLIGEDGSVVKEDGTPFTQYIWGKSWVNNHAHVLKAKKNLSTEGIYILFKDTNVSSYVTGAVQPKINQNNLKRIPILEPSNHLYGEFSKFIDPLFSMVRIRTDETLQLCKLRDYLLPKLLSGEIDVSNLNLEPDND